MNKPRAELLHHDACLADDASGTRLLLDARDTWERKGHDARIYSGPKLRVDGESFAMRVLIVRKGTKE